MNYKTITLKRCAFGEGLYFVEGSLEFDYKDEGEYSRMGCIAYIYEGSDPLVWKKKLIQEQKTDAQSQVNELLQFIGELESFERTLDNKS